MRKLFGLLVKLSLFLAVLVGIARLVAIRWWTIPEDDPYLEASITPTLRAGDLVLLWRFTAPHFGDLVLCPEPQMPERVVIGRIIGLEQETIEISGSSVLKNGKKVQTEGGCYHSKFTSIDPETHSPVEQNCSMEQLGSRLHPRGDAKGQKPAKAKATLTSGQVFLVSDNRMFPYDSRDFGPVERSSCKESVFFRLVGKEGFKDVATRLTFIQ